MHFELAREVRELPKAKFQGYELCRAAFAEYGGCRFHTLLVQPFLRTLTEDLFGIAAELPG